MKGLGVISLFLFSVFLISCGGGGGGSLPEKPKPEPLDIISPTVLKTVPKSEEPDWNVFNLLKITFDEAIERIDTSVVTDQVIVEHLFENGNPVTVNIRQDTKFSYQQDTKPNDTLVLSFGLTGLKDSSHYRVTVKDIKDIFGNTLKTACSWDFTTTGASAIKLGTGLCSEPPVKAPPGKPLYVQAFSVGNKAIITWKAPPEKVKFYKIELSLDGAPYTTLVPENTEPAYIDKADRFVVFPLQKHTYRITAFNSEGFGQSAESNTIDADSKQPFTSPDKPLTAPAAAAYNSFGVTVAVSSSGNFLVVADQSGDIPANPSTNTAGIENAGVVHLYEKTTTKWRLLQTLISSQPTTNNFFGRTIVFGLDDTLYIAEKAFKVNDITDGALHVFVKSDLKWRFTQTLVTDLVDPIIDSVSLFALAVAVSPDNLTLAVSEELNDKRVDSKGELSNGVVHLYARKLETDAWVHSSTLYSYEPTGRPWPPGFGRSLAFGVNDILAVGYHSYDPASQKAYAGTVQIFSKGVYVTSLQSDLPDDFNFFGEHLAFTPDGQYLAVNESNGDVLLGQTNLIISDIGKVHLFKVGSWVRVNTLVSQRVSQSIDKFFDKPVFIDNTTLAVTHNKGFIELFTLISGQWEYTIKLMAGDVDAGYPDSIAPHARIAAGGGKLVVGELKSVPSEGKVLTFNVNKLTSIP